MLMSNFSKMKGMLHFQQDERNAVSMSISQLLLFSAMKKRSKTTNTHIHHSTVRETPIATYIALKAHSKTQSEDVINQLSKLGICISYQRKTQIQYQMNWQTQSLQCMRTRVHLAIQRCERVEPLSAVQITLTKTTPAVMQRRCCCICSCSHPATNCHEPWHQEERTVLS